MSTHSYGLSRSERKTSKTSVKGEQELNGCESRSVFASDPETMRDSQGGFVRYGAGGNWFEKDVESQGVSRSQTDGQDAP